MTEDPGSKTVPASDADLACRRQAIRRELARSNTATVVALLISVGLAVATVFYAFEAQKANERTREELWNSQRAQAMALRLSAKVGRRQEGLRAITDAVGIRPSPELRDEAIATLALMDIQPGSWWRPASPKVNAYAISPRLNYYALGNLGGTVEVYASSNGPAILEMAQDRRAVFQVQFSPDEHYVAARWDAGSVEVWDLPERRRVYGAFYSQREPSTDSLAFHPDSRHLAVACADETVRVIRLESNQVELVLKTEGRPWPAAFDLTGSRLAVGVGSNIVMFAYPSGERLAVFEVSDMVGRLNWHPFGQVLAAGSPSGRVTLLDVRNGRFKVLDAHTQRTIRLAFHPSGRMLVTASWDGRTRFWDAGSGRPLLQTQSGFALGFDAAGERLGFFREGMGVGDWKIDLDTLFGTIAVPLGSPDEIMAVALSREGRWLAATTREGVYLWESQTGRELDSMKWARCWGAAFTEDDQALFLSSDTGLFRVLLPIAAPGGAPRFSRPEPIPGTPKGVFAHGAITYGNRRFFGAEGSADHVFVDLAPPHAVRVMPGSWDNSAPSTVDGRLASTSRWKGQGTRVWNLENQELLKALPDEGGVSLFSPDGRWLVVGTSTEFLFYETEHWKLSRRMPRDSASAISGLLAFSPSGDLLAVTHTLRQVRLLAPSTGVTLANLHAPAPERITSLSFSGDGSVLAAGTDNKEVQIWNLRQLRQRLGAMRLDWSEAASNHSSSPSPAELATVSRIGWEPVSTLVHRRSVLWVCGASALLAFFFALYSIQHHRRLVAAYAEVEGIAAQRRRELESAQAQLFHSQKMKALGTLAAGVAHDFNNLLSIIRMSGQLVRRQLKPTGLAQNNLDAIERAVAQGKRIVGSILGYSRHPSQPDQPYQISVVISETLAMLNAQYLGGLVLTLELESKAPLVRGDKSRLEQILLNLIVNAYEAMKGAGKLTIAVRLHPTPPPCVLPPRTAASYIELSVQDSGPGIDPVTLPRIFEPFFTTKTGSDEHGTGLGLTTVYAIARQDGLGLAVESAFNQGATFRVFVPVDESGSKSG